MFLYLSTFAGDGSALAPFTPTAAAAIGVAGGLWSCFDLRADATQQAGRCLVGTDVQLAPVPAGVTFLLDTANLDAAMPNAVRNTINTQLGSAIPAGGTWRDAFRRLAHVDGQSKWGVVIGNVIHFAVGSIPL